MLPAWLLVSTDKSRTFVFPYRFFVTCRDNRRKSNLVVFLATVECWRTPGLCSRHLLLHTHLMNSVILNEWNFGVFVPGLFRVCVCVLIDFPTLFFPLFLLSAACLSLWFSEYIVWLQKVWFYVYFLSVTTKDVIIKICFSKIDVNLRWQRIENNQPKDWLGPQLSHNMVRNKEKRS